MDVPAFPSSQPAPHILSPQFHDVLLHLFTSHLDFISALRLSYTCHHLYSCAPFPRILENSHLFTRVDKLEQFRTFLDTLASKCLRNNVAGPKIRHLHITISSSSSSSSSVQEDPEFDPLHHLSVQLPLLLSTDSVQPHLTSLHFHALPIRPTTLAWISATKMFPLSNSLNLCRKLNRVALWDPRAVRNPVARNVTEQDLLAEPVVEEPRERTRVAVEGMESFGKLEGVRRVEVVFKSDLDALQFWRF